MSPAKSPLIILAGAALGLTLAACGGSSGSSTSPSSAPVASSAPATSAPPSPIPPASSAAAARTIASTWSACFNPKTPGAQRANLLEDGQDFTAVIQAQASSPLASAATAKATQVTAPSAQQATLIYDLVVAGQSALANQSGTAVLQGGTWKVGLTSFCG